MKSWVSTEKGLYKKFIFDNFDLGVGFINKINEISNKHNHHPDIFLTYSCVKIHIITHKMKKITDKDYNLAKEIDGII